MRIPDTKHLQNIINYYNKIGFNIAIDDFGSGHANLDWLALLEPDSIKIDMTLIRDIDKETKTKEKEQLFHHWRIFAEI